MLCLKAVEETKAINPKLLDMQGRSSITDYVVVCSGSSDRQVKAISESISKELKKTGTYPLGVEGESEGKWILADYDDLVVHIFYEPLREFYNIEALWPFAKEVEGKG